MKKPILISSLLLFVLGALFFSPRPSEEEHFWRKKAQMYLKNPLSLRDEFELHQKQIKDAKPRTCCCESISHSPDVVDSLRWELIKIQGKCQMDSIAFTKIIDSLSSRIRSLEEKEENAALLSKRTP